MGGCAVLRPRTGGEALTRTVCTTSRPPRHSIAAIRRALVGSRLDHAKRKAELCTHQSEGTAKRGVRSVPLQLQSAGVRTEEVRTQDKKKRARLGKPATRTDGGTGGAGSRSLNWQLDLVRSARVSLLCAESTLRVWTPFTTHKKRTVYPEIRYKSLGTLYRRRHFAF